MLLGRIVGTVVATRKDPRLEGKKLLICRPVDPDGKDEKGYIVAVDTVDSGFREQVLIVQGSSARMASGCKDTPVDAAIVGIVDQISQDWIMYLGKVIGRVVSTVKNDVLTGKKLLLIRRLPNGPSVVAIDAVGAGAGETVYVCRGREAAFAFKPEEVPTEATVVAIVDSIEKE
jgi:ethanolamine utilization protein EutN